MTGWGLSLAFVMAVAVMLVSISKFKVHPFLALMGVSLLLAVSVGLPLDKIPGVIGAGFSGTFANIGIVIILGALIGAILETTGAALKLAECVVRLVGPKRPELALGLMGWIVSVPVFCDSGFVILNPIRKALCQKTRRSSVAATVALSAGLYTSHVLIPPTPGPIAAAGALGVGHLLLFVIAVGAVVSLPCLAAGFVFANRIGRCVQSAEDREEQTGPGYDEILRGFGALPDGFLSLAPIAMPIAAMALGSLSAALGGTGRAAAALAFLGAPVIALTVGLLFGVILLVRAGKAASFGALTNETLKGVGPILFITAAGGVLGKVIASAGFVGIMQQHAAVLSSLGIFFPFLVSAILKTAQGSSTVAMTTTAGIMGSIADSGSMMQLLGLTSPAAAALTVMAIGIGSMVVSHANDSYFWVVTNFGGLSVSDGYKTQTAVTLVMGLVAMPAIWLLARLFA